jgi:hypothetical protein
VLRFLPKRALLKRIGRGLPVVEVILAAEVALMAGQHVAKLDSAQRGRLLALLRESRGRPSSLAPTERQELSDLVAFLEPRLFVGQALKRLSPVPLPRRLLYGPRGSAARAAAKRR